MNWRILRWYFISVFIIIADQATKNIATKNLLYGEYINIFTGLNLILVHNTGAAFSFLSDAGGWQRYGLSVLAAIVSVIIVVWISRQPVQRWLESLALALILGGALGNLYDRVTLGYVVDFLDFHWSGHHFPAFNVADSGISVGAVLLIIDVFINRDDGR